MSQPIQTTVAHLRHLKPYSSPLGRRPVITEMEVQRFLRDLGFKSSDLHEKEGQDDGPAESDELVSRPRDETRLSELYPNPFANPEEVAWEAGEAAPEPSSVSRARTRRTSSCVTELESEGRSPEMDNFSATKFLPWPPRRSARVARDRVIPPPDSDSSSSSPSSGPSVPRAPQVQQPTSGSIPGSEAAKSSPSSGRYLIRSGGKTRVKTNWEQISPSLHSTFGSALANEPDIDSNDSDAMSQMRIAAYTKTRPLSPRRSVEVEDIGPDLDADTPSPSRSSWPLDPRRRTALSRRPAISAPASPPSAALERLAEIRKSLPADLRSPERFLRESRRRTRSSSSSSGSDREQSLRRPKFAPKFEIYRDPSPGVVAPSLPPSLRSRAEEEGMLLRSGKRISPRRKLREILERGGTDSELEVPLHRLRPQGNDPILVWPAQSPPRTDSLVKSPPGEAAASAKEMTPASSRRSRSTMSREESDQLFERIMAYAYADTPREEWPLELLDIADRLGLVPDNDVTLQEQPISQAPSASTPRRTYTSRESFVSAPAQLGDGRHWSPITPGPRTSPPSARSTPFTSSHQPVPTLSSARDVIPSPRRPAGSAKSLPAATGAVPRVRRTQTALMLEQRRPDEAALAAQSERRTLRSHALSKKSQ